MVTPRKTHCIESQQFSREDLGYLFLRADEFRNGHKNSCMRDKIVMLIFYEPSTRTRFSFESAILRLDGRPPLVTENAADFSSAIKGESLEDSIRILGAYGDAIVLRHKNNDAAERAAAISSVPIINAGCGMGQHPTQGFLDLYTIRRRRGEIDGLHIALVGDLVHGRTIRSLAYLLGKYKDIRISLVSPPSMRIASDMLEYLKRHSVHVEQYESLDPVVSTVDAIYTTRVQRERIPDLDEQEFTRLQMSYRIDPELVSRMKQDAFIMHPLPRNDELDTAVDALPQAAYFEQAENGLWVRMALFNLLFA